MKACIDCKHEVEDEEEDGERCTDCRMDKEIEAVVEMMKEEWPEAADWTMLDDNTVEILDAKDKRIAVISSDHLDGYYKDLEI